jgi:hypothetical protein
MGHITVKNSRYRSVDVEVVTLNTENFRVVSQLNDNKLFLVTTGLLGVVIENFSLKEFFQLEASDHYLGKYGSTYSFFIPCRKCHGCGIISWIDKIVGVQDQYLQVKFTKNKGGYFYRGIVHIEETLYEALYQISELIEGYEYCQKCYGTGININSKVLKLKQDFTCDEEIPTPLTNIFSSKIQIINQRKVVSCLNIS